MTRKDFFKSAIGALSLFGLAKVLKPVKYEADYTIKWLAHVIQIDTSYGVKMARYARIGDGAKRCEEFSKWMVYNSAINDIRFRWFQMTHRPAQPFSFDPEAPYNVQLREGYGASSNALLSSIEKLHNNFE